MAAAGGRPPAGSSWLFSPTSVAGLVADEVAPALYTLNGEGMVAVSLGRSYNLLSRAKLRVVFRSPFFEQPIKCLAADDFGHIFVVLKGAAEEIRVFDRAREVRVLRGHRRPIERLAVVSRSSLLSRSDSEVLVWAHPAALVAGAVNDEPGAETAAAGAGVPATNAGAAAPGAAGSVPCGPASSAGVIHSLRVEVGGCSKLRRISAVYHPKTFVNKLLVAFEGTAFSELHLYNVSSGQRLHVFGFPHELRGRVTALAATAHPAVAAAGTSAGDVCLFDVEADEILKVLACGKRQGGVTALSGPVAAADGAALYACGCANGDVNLWNTVSGELLQTVAAHPGARVTALHALPGEPVLLTAGADNAVAMWRVERAAPNLRLLRERRGFPGRLSHLELYDEEGGTEWIVAAAAAGGGVGGGGVVGRLSLILAEHTGVFSQKRLFAGFGDGAPVLAPVIGVAAAPTRHFDWPNVVSLHRDTRHACLWSAHDRSLTRGRLALAKKDVPGAHRLLPTVVAASTCGHFAYVGYSDGSLHRFGLQAAVFKDTLMPSAAAAAGGGGGAGFAAALAVDRGTGIVFFATSAESRIFRFSARGKRLAPFVLPTEAGEQFRHVWSLALQGPFVVALVGVAPPVNPHGGNSFLRVSASADSSVAPVKEECGENSEALAESREWAGRATEPTARETHFRVLCLDATTGRQARATPTFACANAPAVACSTDGRWLVHSRDCEILVYDFLSMALLDWMVWDGVVRNLKMHPADTFLLVTVENHAKNAVLLLANRRIFELGNADSVGETASVRAQGPIRLGGPGGEGRVAVPPPPLPADASADEDAVRTLLFPPDTDEEGTFVLSGAGLGKINAIQHLEQMRERTAAAAAAENVVDKPSDVPFFLPTATSAVAAQSFQFHKLGAEAAAATGAHAATGAKSVGQGGGNEPGGKAGTNKFLTETHTDKLAALVGEVTEDWVGFLRQPDALAELLAVIEGQSRLQPRDGRASFARSCYDTLCDWLLELTPAALHLMLHEAGPAAGRTNADFRRFVAFFSSQVGSRRKCDFVQVLLRIFLDAHSGALIDYCAHSDAAAEVRGLADLVATDCRGLEMQAQHAECFLRCATHLQFE